MILRTPPLPRLTVVKQQAPPAFTRPPNPAYRLVVPCYSSKAGSARKGYHRWSASQRHIGRPTLSTASLPAAVLQNFSISISSKLFRLRFSK